jgi:acylphosphatase
MSADKTVFLAVKGRVQEVMFRKTLIYGALKHGIKAGGTNAKDDLEHVDITLSGAADKVDGFIAAIQLGRPLNSIGAEIHSFEVVDRGLPIEAHVTHTGQFQTVSPPPGVEFYL